MGEAVCCAVIWGAVSTMRRVHSSWCVATDCAEALDLEADQGVEQAGQAVVTGSSVSA